MMDILGWIVLVGGVLGIACLIVGRAKVQAAVRWLKGKVR